MTVGVGVGVAVLNRKGEILLGKRVGSHGEGQWAMPGGHIDPGESPRQAAEREMLEECALSVGAVLYPLPVWTYDDYLDEHGKHYICVYFAAHVGDAQPVNCEPEACEDWQWFDTENLPEPLFGGAQEVCDHLDGAVLTLALAARRGAACICGRTRYPEPCPVHDPGRVGS